MSESSMQVDDQLHSSLPRIGSHDSFVRVVKNLSVYFVDEILLPSTFEQLRTTTAGNKIKLLVDHLVVSVHNPVLISALLTLKWHFSTLEGDDRGLNDTRAHACEIVAWRFLTRISEHEAVEFCLYELPPHSEPEEQSSATGAACAVSLNEQSSLLPQFRAQDASISSKTHSRDGFIRSLSSMGLQKIAGQIPAYSDDEEEEDPTNSFAGLNGLEIAAVGDCKRFLSQRIVQKIVTGIWNGDITFWDGLNDQTVKKPQFYRKNRSDPYSRLRVPRYIKAFEVAFFATFLFLYYAVLVERNPYHITVTESLLYVWFAAFTYDELSEFIDAGSIFYAVDLWNGCDIVIILIGAAFLLCRIIGLVKDSDQIIDTSFDILSLEALFMVPRICSILSLHPYFGTLIPCLKEMAKDFVKFMVVVAILYLGFLTTFTLLARDTFTLTEMSWILIKVFFGSSYLGFDIMNEINPKLGPPLMLIFVCMTNILLITSLISILSDSFSKVIAHAKEEYLFVYSVYVLEASTSNRLTHFYPPLNLIPLILIRPLRICLPASHLRSTRIVLLKITHAPIVGCIWLFERMHEHVNKSGAEAFSTTNPERATNTIIQKNKDTATSKLKKQKPFLSKAQSSANQESQPISDVDGAASPELRREAYIKGKKEGSKEGRDILARERVLEDKVADLSAKIEELTALIMAERGAVNEE